jgi:hypothetical protein
LANNIHWAARTSASAPSAGTPRAAPPPSWATSAPTAPAARTAAPTPSTPSGTAVGDTTKYTGGTSLGYRAVRWDASGTAATELGNLGTEGTGYTESTTQAINIGRQLPFAFNAEDDELETS